MDYIATYPKCLTLTSHRGGDFAPINQQVTPIG